MTFGVSLVIILLEKSPVHVYDSFVVSSSSNALQSSVFWVGLTVFVCVFFQPDRVMEFCKNNDLQLIVRAHECVMDGFERFAQGHLITLFSATNYCGT